MDETKRLIGFLELAGALKKTKRTGWVLRKIPEAESVADHSFRLALIALLLGKKAGIDTDRAVKMALVHDLAEAITGDIPRDYIDDYGNSLGIKPHMTKEQKKLLEENAMKQIKRKLGGGNTEILVLWKEFEEQKTKTARFVKELEPIELLLQALEYKKQFPENKALNDFFDYVEKKHKIPSYPEPKRILKQIMKEFAETEKRRASWS